MTDMNKKSRRIVKREQRGSKSFSGVDFFVGAVGERMMIIYVNLKKGQEVVAHAHPHEQAGYCIRGHFLLTIDGVPSEIETNDSYVIPGDASHSLQVFEDTILVEMFSPPREEYR
ncbi:cupin domain-containing protein [bacterium]|nr:cupin domain-containing protein [bacterium]MBU1937428.1 cupin domain-containing protein [bacterium]